jgi:hypothetical protein
VTALRVEGGVRDLRRAVRPVAWFVLEELLLGDGEHDDDAFVARASARSVASALSLNKDTVARALAALVRVGVGEPVRQTSTAGRFSAGGYRLVPPAGLSRLDDEVSATTGRPPGTPRPRPERAHEPTQLSLLDVAAREAAAPTHVDHPAAPLPADALAPGVPGRRGTPPRDDDGTAETPASPC